MSANNAKSVSKKENSMDWRKDWREYLTTTVSKEMKECMIRVNIENGSMSGVCKRGEEVVEVTWNRRENENNVELILVHLKNHSIRVLKGSEGEELTEMDLSELVENEIVDLNVDGRRWEGGVLKEDVFGYGRLYDEENRIEYDGWIIEGKKRCYGIEYWSDTGLMKYSGCYFNGLKNGYGILYDLKGNVIYRGYFNDDCGIGENIEMKWGRNSELSIDSYVVTLMITNGFSSANSSLILNYSLISLKQIEIGNDCFKKVSQFVIDGLSELESVKIGWSSFYLDKSLRRDSKCVIMNCDRLKEIHVGGFSFCYCESFELKNLPSLISIQLDESSFYQCNSVIFESMNDRMNNKQIYIDFNLSLLDMRFFKEIMIQENRMN